MSNTPDIPDTDTSDNAEAQPHDRRSVQQSRDQAAAISDTSRLRGEDHGYRADMSDYTEHGAEPVVDAAVEHPPTVDEVMAAQEREDPEQAATRLGSDPSITSIEDLPDKT